jgi:hypothetical protein
MNREIYRYKFDPSVPAQEIEDSILLSILAAEGLHGQAQVRLDAGYAFDHEKRICVIEAGSEVGRDVCRLFAGFAIREFGESSFTVERVDDAPEPEKEKVPA